MQLATIFCFVLRKAPEKLLQVTLECDGVTIHGNIARISSYPEHIANVQPITVIGQFAYFSALKITQNMVAFFGVPLKWEKFCQF